MCMQCMATAMTAGAATTGVRAWLAARNPCWLTPRRLKRATVAILAAGVLAAGTHVAPNGGAAVAKDAPQPAVVHSAAHK
jgi:hypothetical protein